MALQPSSLEKFKIGGFVSDLCGEVVDATVQLILIAPNGARDVSNNSFVASSLQDRATFNDGCWCTCEIAANTSTVDAALALQPNDSYYVLRVFAGGKKVIEESLYLTLEDLQAATPVDLGGTCGPVINIFDVLPVVPTTPPSDAFCAAVEACAIGGSVDITDNLDGTYTFNNGVDAPTVIDTTIDFTALTAQQQTDLCGAIAPVLTVSTGPDGVVANATTSQTVDCGDNLHFHSTDGTINVGVTAGSAVVDVEVNEANLNIAAADVSVLDTAGNYTATDVEGVLAELASSAGTDDQTAAEVPVVDTAGNFTATDVEGVLAELAAASGNTSVFTATTNADGSVSLSHTDGSGAAAVTATIPAESLVPVTAADVGNAANAGEQFGVDAATGAMFYVDAAGEWQQVPVAAAGVSVADTAGNFTATDVEGVLAELAAASSDDQNAGEVPITDAGGNFTATDVEGALAELAGLVVDDVLSATAASVGTAAPAGAQLGVDPATGATFYVDAAGDWQAAPVYAQETGDFTGDSTDGGLTGTTTFTVTHNLGLATPFLPGSAVFLHPDGSLMTLGDFTATNVTANSFDVVFSSAPTTAETFNWKVTS